MYTVLLALTLAAAHPLHSSSAEITIDRRTGDLVVTIRAFLNDVTSDAGSLAPEAWLRRDFRLRDARGAPIALRLVERRIRADVVYFTLRATAPPQLAGMRVHHALLQRQFGDQVNVVRVRQGRRTATFIFTPGDGPVVLP